LIARWKGQALKQLPAVFARRQSQAQAAPLKPLYQEISQLEDQLDYLRDRLPASANQKRLLVEPSHPILSTVRQCELLGLARSSYYYTKSRT
jgi:Tfp pilus assembly protein PilO